VISHFLQFDPPRGFVEPSFLEWYFSLSKSGINHDDLRQNVFNQVASPLSFKLDQNSFLNDSGLSLLKVEQFYCQTIVLLLRATPAQPVIQLFQITDYHDTFPNRMTVLRFFGDIPDNLQKGSRSPGEYIFRSLFTFSKNFLVRTAG
jgi:hypothetical protein